MSQFFLVKCNFCGLEQGYECKTSPIGKRKECVGCGRSFGIHRHIAKQTRIVEKLKDGHVIKNYEADLTFYSYGKITKT